MKASELHGKSAEELKGLILDLKKEQFNLRMQAATGELENRSRFKEARRTIARAKTLLGGKATTPSAQKTEKKAAAKKPAAKKAKKEKE